MAVGEAVRGSVNAAEASRGVLTALVLVLLCASPLAAVAAPASSVAPAKDGITITPALKDIVIGPGLLQASADIGLANNTNQDLSATIKVVDFEALDKFGGVSLGQAGVPVSKYGLASWMSIPSGNTLTLSKGQSTNVKVAIDNRADLSPGGHYGAVVVTASAGDSAGGNKVSFKQELVSLVFLKKLGGEQYGLKLGSFTHSGGPGVPGSISTRFMSTGNVHVVPRGFIDVTDPTGKVVAKGILNPESSLVLPGTDRQFVTLLQPVAESSLPGKYNITAHYRYDGQSKFDTKSVYFTRGVLSSKLIITTGLTVLITLLVMYKIHRNRRKKIRLVAR